MSLILKTLLTKNVFTKPDGDAVIDITRQSIDQIKFAQLRTVNTYVVSEYDIMRPDLIAKRTLGDHNLLDVILKYNGISNPFSVNVGDVLIIPGNIGNGIHGTPVDIKNIGDVKIPDVSEKVLNPKTVKDKKRLEELSKNRQPLPSNINKKGDKNVKISDGKLIFGEDVTTLNKDKCPEPLSRAKLKQALIKNKLLG